ncbi:MAG: hypothetical protein R3212_11365, partial [Xanthomonadales bacterium]|nr:hypothetical protein [Xanthomonadales bacterium]
ALFPMMAGAGITDQTLARFVGEWNMDLTAHEESFAEHGGPGSGTMICAWGLMQAWVDCQMDARYEGFGDYGLKVVLYRLGADGAIGAFVTNSWGGGRLYEGALNASGDLEFRDAWVDPNRKWQHQRTVYSFEHDGRIRFAIDVADDGVNYVPHSSGLYQPR